MSAFWHQHLFTLVIIASLLFIALTLMSILFYPGGTVNDPTTAGYSFSKNFFSELGLARSHAGQPNTISRVLFTFATTLAGLGLALFFVCFTQFFVRRPSERIASIIGACFGLISGVCFIGVGAVTMDLHRHVHHEIVLWAFRTFLVAVALNAVAIFRGRDYSRVFGWVFVTFGVLLTAYVLLLIVGPETSTPEGLSIQVVGQKVIVYASIVTILTEAVGAKRANRRQAKGPAAALA